MPKIKPKEVVSKYGFPLVSKDVAGSVAAVKINPDSKRSQLAMGKINTGYSCSIPRKWRYLVDEPYMVHDICCRKLKKEPFRNYMNKTGLSPILGIMACESENRTTLYIREGGCNVFSEKTSRYSQAHSKSSPLSIWLEDDIWEAINRYNIPICDIYNKGMKRTGCAFCMFGAQFEDDPRLKFTLENYPKLYRTFMGYENNGTTYREAARKMLAVHDMTLPDEDEYGNIII